MSDQPAKIGQRAQLTVLKHSAPGYFLDSGGELGNILLPRNEIVGPCEVGESVDVFIYCDSEDRPVATMKHPKAMPGGFACLECVSVTGIGSFLDWGLAKDLFVPFREQNSRLDVGKSYVVYVYVDPESDRIVASRRINRYLSKEEPDYTQGEQVDLMVYAKTDLGYKAIINGQHSGVLFANEVFTKPAPGEKLTGYIAKLRSDGKIDLSLQPLGQSTQDKIQDLESRIEEELAARNGFWSLCDSSPPDDIYQALGVSKKAFKKATGALFKKRKITITKEGIRSV
jgi:predicted RNA-binding protein (virulence factor B family)